MGEVTIKKCEKECEKLSNQYEQYNILYSIKDEHINVRMAYSKKVKVIILHDMQKFTYLYDKIFEALLKYFEPSTLVYIYLPLDDRKSISFYLERDFRYPYVTTSTPCGCKVKPSIALARKILDEKVNKIFTLNKILQLSEQYNEYDENTSCHLYAKLTTTTVDYLKKTTSIGYTEPNSEQREITGELTVSNIVKLEGKFVYEIEVKSSSIEYGENDNVDVVPKRYNFHSHPKDAYAKFSVKYAWPSKTDYLGFLGLGKDTIFHCISTLEGIYILSFSPYWCKRLSEVDTSFIEKHYNIGGNSMNSPREYVKHVNNIAFKNHPIFHLTFYEWNEATTPFKVNFASSSKTDEKTGCIVTEDIFELYNKLYTE